MVTEVSKNIFVTDATHKDLDLLNHILRLSKAYWGYNDAFLDLFMQKLSLTGDYLQKSTTKLFFVDNDLAGFYSFSMQKNGSLELDNFFLHPDYIGKGLGIFLWRECCKTARKLGKNEFTLWSDPNAESFYLKMGCEKIGVRKSPMMPNRYPAVFRYRIP